ncbi:MAG: hypothetical protein QMD66_03030 [Actinomycetota bacterium]|nr:hypothetical protein [Actinomycetota bacterium]MDI6821836.1 hypothetical protein [Actinomycetota bacterium]
MGITFGEWNLYYIADPARSSSTLGNPIYLGGYLVRVIPVAMIIVLCTEEFWDFIPFVADLHARGALDHLQFGLYDDAIGEAKLAVRLYPLEEEYLFLLGKIYEFKSDAQGDPRWYKEAISTYIEALRFNPRERNGYARLGDAYLKVAEKGSLKMGG